MAAVGKVRIRVHRRPRVAVLTTGDEIVAPSQRPAAHQIRNSNSAALLALLGEEGIEAIDLGTASDAGEDLERAVAEGLRSDVLLVTGGVSMGRYDLVGEVLERAGMERLFHKVSMKPGKPLLAGRHGGCLVAGLPGNPVSAFTVFTIFLAPVLRKMMGCSRWENALVRATTKGSFRGSPERTVYNLARLDFRRNGAVVRPSRSSGSGDVLSMARANAFAVCPMGEKIVPTDTEVDVVPWRDSWLRPE
jgi:molybdopterin molybdotransferase